MIRYISCYLGKEAFHCIGLSSHAQKRGSERVKFVGVFCPQNSTQRKKVTPEGEALAELEICFPKKGLSLILLNPCLCQYSGVTS